MMSDVIIKIRCKFQFEIILQFYWTYWTATKVTRIELVTLMVKGLEKCHHLFKLHIFGYYFAFYD